MLNIEDLHVYYGEIHALKGVSLEVERGEIVALLGNNGAGKTTTLRTISGLLAPRQGRVGVGDDLAGLFAAWVIAGDVDFVGQLLAGGRHLGALGLVVAGAAAADPSSACPASRCCRSWAAPRNEPPTAP